MAVSMSNYYINQSDFSSKVTWPNTSSSLKGEGCVVCSYAMIACYRLGLSSDDDKTAVLKELISAYVGTDGKFTNPSSVKVKGKTFSVTNVSDMAQSAMDGTPVICRLKDVHNVVITDYKKAAGDFSDYKILDPGGRARTNLKETMDAYSVTTIEYKKTF